MCDDGMACSGAIIHNKTPVSNFIHEILGTLSNKCMWLQYCQIVKFWRGRGGVKQPGRGVSHTLPSSTEVVDLYLYMSGPSWPFTGRTLPLLSPRFQYLLISCLSSIRDLLQTVNSQSKTVLVAADTAALLSCSVIDHCNDCMNGVVSNLNRFVKTGKLMLNFGKQIP
jgi:hypothetical protein